MHKYLKISKNIQQITIDNPKTDKRKLYWIDICNAGKNEIEFLRKKYKFELADLQASSAKAVAQRPIVSKRGKYLFMILHFPIFQFKPLAHQDKNNTDENTNYVQYSIAAGEIEFFIGKNYLITLHNNNIKALSDFFNYCKKDGEAILAYEFESPSVLIYELLKKLILSCYPILDQNSIEIANVEEIIFKQKQKIAVAQILALRRNIINFRKVMQNHKNIIKKLMNMESDVIPEAKIRKYFNELLEHSKRIWEILENQKDMVEVLNGTNESLLNYKISNIMKTLTIFSVIVFPLTLLAAIFGMNVVNGMPFMQSANGFWIIIAIMVMGSLGMLLIFEKKKWL